MALRITAFRAIHGVSQRSMLTVSVGKMNYSKPACDLEGLELGVVPHLTCSIMRCFCLTSDQCACCSAVKWTIRILVSKVGLCCDEDRAKVTTNGGGSECVNPNFRPV